jgi:hypothetical protein
MTEIFLSYSSKDRARVQPLRDALTDRGFSVFWDQEVPANSDWDTWIRQHLNESKCTIVVWSAHSILSNNVRHEAVIARQQNKMVPVMLDAIAADQFPMGLYTVQAANLCAWTGDTDSGDWQNVLREVESRLSPPWIRRTLDVLEAELVSERARSFKPSTIRCSSQSNTGKRWPKPEMASEPSASRNCRNSWRNLNRNNERLHKAFSRLAKRSMS